MYLPLLDAADVELVENVVLLEQLLHRSTAASPARAATPRSARRAESAVW